MAVPTATVGKLDEEYIAKMEDVLKIYERPLSKSEPVVCVDEKPVFRIRLSNASFFAASFSGALDVWAKQGWCGGGAVRRRPRRWLRNLKPVDCSVRRFASNAAWQ